ncbi:hypothetical protein ABK040_015985 [Willaertia magna]
MQQLPFEIIEIIYSYFHSPFDLKLNIQTFRYLNKHFYEFTENDIFWNHLIKYQRINNFHLHQWFYKYMFKRNATIYNEILSQKKNVNTQIVVKEEDFNNEEIVNSNNEENKDESCNEEDEKEEEENTVLFPVVVKKWIDMFCRKELKGENGECNKLLQFLLKISFSNNVLQYFTPNNMLSCFHYLFYKLLEPTLQYVNNNENNIFDNNYFMKENLFNLDILNFLQNLNESEEKNKIQMNLDNWWDCIVISYWKDIELFYNIFPKNYLLHIVNKFSNIFMSNENTDVATFIVKELYKCGMNVHLFDFYNYGKYSNFDVEPFQEWIPPFTKRFLLQHFALWKENFNLLEFCLNPNGNDTNLDRILRNLQNETNVTFEKRDKKISIFTMCNLTDNIGFTCLHYAIKKRDIKLIKLLLLQYQANPFQRSKYNFISPIELATLLNDKEVLNTLNEIIGEEAINLHLKNKEKKKECYQFLNENKEEVCEKDEDKIEDDKVEKIINLEETEEKDLQKLLDYSMEYNGIPIRQNFSMERQEYNQESKETEITYELDPNEYDYRSICSEEDKEELMISLNWLKKNEELNNKKENCLNILTGEKQLINKVIEGQQEEMNQFNKELKPYENVEVRNENHWPYDYLSIHVGKRKLEEKFEKEGCDMIENKKLKVEENNNNLECIPSIIKRGDSLFTEKYTTRCIARKKVYEYTGDGDIYLTPMAINILQQGIENYISKEIFSNANHFATFFERDFINLIDIKSVNELILNANTNQGMTIDILGIKEYIYWKLNKINQFNELINDCFQFELSNNENESELYSTVFHKIIEELEYYNINIDNDDVDSNNKS